LLAVLAALAAGCGGDDDDSGGSESGSISSGESKVTSPLSLTS
jgi:hypothetical protein